MEKPKIENNPKFHQLLNGYSVIFIYSEIKKIHTHKHIYIIYIMISKNNPDTKHIMHPSRQNISKDIVQQHYHQSTGYN